MQKVYRFILIASVLFCAVAEGVFPYFEPQEEAQLLALDISGRLQPPQELTQQILNDLAAIRAAYPEVADVGYRAPYVPDRISVGLTAEAAAQFQQGLYHGLDTLNELYGVVEIDANRLNRGSSHVLKLKFDKIYNTKRLSDIYEQVRPEGLVFAEADYATGDGSTIFAKPPDYTFIEAWGDCLAGCTEERSWHFRVEKGVVNLLQITGSGGSQLLVPAQYPTIQSAIDDAIEGDTVIVQPGRYFENIDLKGKAIRVASSVGPAVTIIDGNGFGPVVQCVSGEEPNTVLEGFTITAGYSEFGGGMYNENSGPTVANCIFSNNNAGFGGGMFNKAGNPTVVNCVFKENQATDGAGMYGEGSLAAISNCTFWQNSASRSGDALCVRKGSNIVTNCILWEEYGKAINKDCSKSVSVTYSDVGGGFAGRGNIDIDPGFADESTGNLRLKSDSPCIDAGDDGAITADLTDLDNDGDITEPIPFDINRKARIWGEAVDIGAFEYRPNLPPIAGIAGGDRTIEITGEQTTVILDGSCSIDYDSTAGTNDDIEYFDWFLRVDPCDRNADEPLGSGKVIDCNLPLGVHTVVLETTDKAGQWCSGEIRITVVEKDTTPPIITVNGPETVIFRNSKDSYQEAGALAFDEIDGSVPVIIGGDKVNTKKCGTYVVTYDAVDSSGNRASQARRTIIVPETKPPYFRLWVKPRVLRPHNHQMVRVTPKWVVRDNTDDSPEVSLVGIVAVENGVEVANMNNSSDIAVAADGAIYLRAESSRDNVRRYYFITYQTSDDWGNVTVKRVKCVVSRD